MGQKHWSSPPSPSFLPRHNAPHQHGRVFFSSDKLRPLLSFFLFIFHESQTKALSLSSPPLPRKLPNLAPTIYGQHRPSATDRKLRTGHRVDRKKVMKFQWAMKRPSSHPPLGPPTPFFSAHKILGAPIHPFCHPALAV